LLPDPAAPLVPEWHGAVHERFVQVARSAPERPAILAGDRVWTYGELDAASAGLAHHLREQGVGTGDVVAVYAPRGAGLVLSLLGALRAGAAFLILDPAYPEARLASCLTQARPRALVTLAAAGPAGSMPAGLEEAIATLAPFCRVDVPEDWRQAGWAAPPAGFVPAPVGPDDLAYVAFTSGSTGVPKGILGSHGPLSHFLTWHTGTFGLNETDRFSLLSGLSHDPLLRDVFTPLCLGAALCIPRAAEMLEPERLVEWLAGSGVTVAHLTPAMGQLLDSGGATGTLPLRLAFFGGGVLDGRDVARLRRLAPGCTAVNFYGTTETPQAMAFHPVAGEPPEGAVPLGRGIDGVQLLVLGRSGGLAAPGERGEIHVRTPYLAKGYLGDPGLTAERFLANPWTGRAGDRLYRTGDLGRYRLDGTVEYLGRADDQVSVRGFRVEPGEVQAVLRQHPRVKEAAVVAVTMPGTAGEGGEAGETRLAAYVVPDGELRTGDLRQFLVQRLPDYMAPSYFLTLE
ncbi:MAG TPA: amino acid adenylation domain-containing protein, partial [Candidatus Dormibacteraeota bacterium]